MCLSFLYFYYQNIVLGTYNQIKFYRQELFNADINDILIFAESITKYLEGCKKER